MPPNLQERTGIFAHLPFRGKVQKYPWLQCRVPTAYETLRVAGTADEDFEQNLHDLWMAGLIVSWNQVTQSANPLHKQIRPVPLGLGNGAKMSDPTRFEIIVGSIVALTTDVLHYVFWQYCDGIRSLANMLKATATYFAWPLDQVYQAILPTLDIFLSTGVMALDALSGDIVC